MAFLGDVMRLLVLIFTVFASIALGAFEEIESLKAGFIQTIRSVDAKEITYKGRLYALSPYYALWRYEKPMEKEIYVHNRQVVVYEPDLFQATVSTLKDSIDFIALLRGAKKIDEQTYETVILDQRYRVLAPRGVPQSIQFTDKLDNQVFIELRDVELNSKIDKELFIFIPESSIDIIRP